MKNSITIGLLAVVICLLCANQGFAFYQWEDENGVVHFGDAPPEDVQDALEARDNEVSSDSETPAPPLPASAPASRDKDRGEVFTTPEVPVTIKEVIDTVSLAPHTRKEISFVAFEPVKIGFKTDLTEESAARCKNSGAGIKDRYTGKEVISPYGGIAEFKPENGYIKFYVGNLEDFPIRIKVFKY